MESVESFLWSGHNARFWVIEWWLRQKTDMFLALTWQTLNKCNKLYPRWESFWMLERVLLRECIISDTYIHLCKNIVALGIPTGWSWHFFVSPAVHTIHMIKYLLGETTHETGITGNIGGHDRGQYSILQHQAFFPTFSSFLSPSLSPSSSVTCPISSLHWPNPGSTWGPGHSGSLLSHVLLYLFIILYFLAHPIWRASTDLTFLFVCFGFVGFVLFCFNLGYPWKSPGKLMLWSPSSQI